MKFLRIILSVIFSSLVGCAWFHPNPSTANQASQFVESGRVVNPTILEKGGRVLMVPFKAGADVEATPGLDRVSLMMIRGFADTLNGAHPTEIIFTAEEDEADFIITGHITQLSQSSKFKKWILRNHKIILSIDGKMVDARTKKTILVFSDTQTAKNKKSTFEELGQILGRNVAKFILSEFNPQPPSPPSKL